MPRIPWITCKALYVLRGENGAMTNLSSFGRNDNRWKPIQFKFLLPFAFARTCPDTMPMAAAQVSAHGAACGFMNSSVIFLNLMAQLLSYFLADNPNALFFMMYSLFWFPSSGKFAILEKCGKTGDLL